MEAPRVARGAACIGLMNFTDALIAFGFYFFLARILPPSDVGYVSMMFFAIAGFNSFTLLALNSAVIKYVSEFMGRNDQDMASAVAGKVARILLVISFLAFILVIVLSSWVSPVIFGASVDRTVMIVTFLSALLMNFNGYFGAIMYGLGMFEGVAAQSIIYYALSRFPALILAFLGLGILGIGLGLVVGTLFAMVYAILRLRGKLNRPMNNFPSKKLLSFSLPLYASQILAFGQGWLDVVLLFAITRSPTIAGVYYLVIGGISVISIFQTPVTQTILPAMSHRYGQNGVGGFQNHISSAFRILTVIVVPLCVGLAAVAPTALRVAYGNAYSQHALAFSILALVAVLNGYWGVLSGALQVLEKTVQVLLAAVIGLVANALVIFVTAGSLGSVGAALGRSSMITIMVLVAFVVLKKNSSLNLSLDARLATKIFLLSLMIGVPLLFVDVAIRALVLRPLVAGTIDIATFLILSFAGFKLLKPLSIDDASLLELALPGRFRSAVHIVLKMMAV